MYVRTYKCVKWLCVCVCVCVCVYACVRVRVRKHGAAPALNLDGHCATVVRRCPVHLGQRRRRHRLFGNRAERGFHDVAACSRWGKAARAQGGAERVEGSGRVRLGRHRVLQLAEAARNVRANDVGRVASVWPTLQKTVRARRARCAALAAVQSPASLTRASAAITRTLEPQPPAAWRQSVPPAPRGHKLLPCRTPEPHPRRRWRRAWLALWQLQRRRGSRRPRGCEFPPTVCALSTLDRVRPMKQGCRMSLQTWKAVACPPAAMPSLRSQPIFRRAGKFASAGAAYKGRPSVPRRKALRTPGARMIGRYSVWRW